MIYYEWIASTGTQYIDTKLKAGADKRIVLTGRCRSNSPSDQTVIGGNGGPNSCIFLGFNWASAYNGYYFKWSGTWIDVRNVADTMPHTWDLTIKSGQQVLKRDDVTIHSTTQAITVSSPTDNLLLFRRNDGSSPASFELHSMQIYDGATGELLRDFLPAENDNAKIGLYDQVTGNFYDNAGTGTFLHGDPLGEFYTVEFDAAGGTGDMPDQRIEIDQPTALNACAYVRPDYVFAGWATSAGGPVVYADGETVTNLAGSDETVTLYAVWQPAPLSIDLQFNKTDRDHLDKELETLHTLAGVFREDCDIANPVILLEGGPDMLESVNYFTIANLRRSYFLTGYRIIRTGLIEIAGHVDVLTSFKDAIRAQTAIIRRAESDAAYNLYLNDGSLHVYADPFILTEPFPSGFTSPSFVLAVAGSAAT